MMNENDGNKITINFKRVNGEPVFLSVKKTDKPIDIIPQLQQKWSNFKVSELVFNGNNILNCEQTWSELTEEDSIIVFAGGFEDLITVHFEGTWLETMYFQQILEKSSFDIYVEKDAKICDIRPIIEKKFTNFEFPQLILNNGEVLRLKADHKINDKTWGDLCDGNDINVIVRDSYHQMETLRNALHGDGFIGTTARYDGHIENQSTIKWNFICSSLPFLVLTLLALIFQ